MLADPARQLLLRQGCQQGATELAESAKTKGPAALKAITDIRDIKEKSQAILEDFKKNPHKAHANAMSIMAQLDPCVRARKCMLVPYQNTKGLGDKLTKEISGEEGGGGLKAIAQARHGNGCCPGQTGHHILPDAMVKDADCPGYDYDMAPTVCLEGTKNGKEHGSHGMAHGNLKESIGGYKEKFSKDTISYEIIREIKHKAGKPGVTAVEVQAGSRIIEKLREFEQEGLKRLEKESGVRISFKPVEGRLGKYEVKAS